MTFPHEDLNVVPDRSTVVLLRRKLRPGTDQAALSVFGDTRWNLSPAIFEDHHPSATISFEACTPTYLTAAKTYVWVLLNTRDPLSLRRSGGTRGSSVLTIAKLGVRLFAFFEFLAVRGVPTLADVTSRDYDAYLAGINEASIPLAEREDLVTEVRRLWLYREQMPAAHRLGDRVPWDGDDTQLLVGKRSPMAENAIPRIHAPTMDALLLWAIHYVDDFSDDIVTAFAEYALLSKRNYGRSPAPRTRAPGELIALLPAFLDQLRSRGDGLPGMRDAGGALVLDLQQVRRMVDSAGSSFKTGSSARQLLETSGLHITDGARLESPITGTIDGEPWRAERFYYLEAPHQARLLTTACGIVIAYLSGMRSGELLSLRRGCVHHDENTDLWTITGTTWKAVRGEDGGKKPEGEIREDPWVVTPVVARAVAVLERLHDQDLLFPRSLTREPVRRKGGNSRTAGELSTDTRDFVVEVNSYCAARGRRDVVPPEPVARPLSLGRFRRTLAWFIYRRPRGLVAGAIQYGHLRTRMFLGYAGNYTSGFVDELAMESLLLRLETVAADAAALDAGEHVSGPAAVAYVHRVRDGHERFAGKVLRTRHQVTSMLQNPSLQIFEGRGLTCVFDRLKALCEVRSDEHGTAAEPRREDCRPNCGNIARTDRDIDGVREDMLRLEDIVGDPLSPSIRHKREHDTLERYREIVTEHERTRAEPSE